MYYLLKLLFFFVCCLVLSAVLWQHFIVDDIYYCVWGIPYIDFFIPNHWYHGSDSGDMIKPGWSKSKLLTLWYSIIAVSVFVSVVLTWLSNKKLK